VLRQFGKVTLEALLGGGVELFGLRDVLDHLLNDDAVVDAGVAGVDLDMVVAGHGGHLDGLLGLRLTGTELLPLDAQLLSALARAIGT
jgi:hypothetical protein